MALLLDPPFRGPVSTCSPASFVTGHLHGHRAVSKVYRAWMWSLPGGPGVLHLQGRSLLQSPRQEAPNGEIGRGSRSQASSRTFALDEVSSLIALEVPT